MNYQWTKQTTKKCIITFKFKTLAISTAHLQVIYLTSEWKILEMHIQAFYRSAQQPESWNLIPKISLCNSKVHFTVAKPDIKISNLGGKLLPQCTSIFKLWLYQSVTLLTIWCLRFVALIKLWLANVNFQHTIFIINGNIYSPLPVITAITNYTYILYTHLSKSNRFKTLKRV